MAPSTQGTPPENPKDPLSQGDHIVNLNGVDLHYQVQGNGPLLFLVSPGWGVGSVYLQRGFKFLQEQFRLVFVDTRGSGLSSPPSNDAKMGTNDMADDLEALREHLSLPAIQLLGHSNGGAIALSYAQRYQDRTHKLILIDSQLFGFGASADTQAFLQNRAEDPRYKAAVQTAIGMFSGQAKPLATDDDLSTFVADILPLYLQSPEKNLASARGQLLAGPIALYAFNAQRVADSAAGNDQTISLDQVRASTLIVSGRHDWICPLAVAQRLHAGIADSRLVIFEESGHMPWIEETERFNAELIRFLTT